ncbi:MAG: T9SS type A sorting domain-containing protein [Bacteroidales bacterium]|nr:T9SS type A sorting domain-containing protein [Bacteroidales bacterium]
MKRSFILLFIIALPILQGKAQIVTDGTGAHYTLSDFTASHPEAVVCTAPGVYHLYEDFILTAPDSLQLEDTLQALIFHNGLTFNVQGTLLCDERNDLLTVAAELDSLTTPAYEWRFEEGSHGTVRSIAFENGKSIFLTGCEVTVRNCEFSGFTESAIRMMQCNPVIEECYFHDNHAAAIQSPANAESSPRIINNRLYNNVLDNTNNPQINLGIGGTDTIVITGNRIEGVASTMSGGIAISNLVGAEQVTQVLLSGNTITHNRYGYTQTGTNISAEILDNIITDNNLETDPMNGGSGISIYGYDTTCYAKIRRNIIAGNLWGVTAVYRYRIDMGTNDDWGHNVLYDNSNDGELYAFAMSQYSTLDVTAIGNYWGANDTAFAESVILHKADQSNLGRVEYEPILPIFPTVYGVSSFEHYPFEYEREWVCDIDSPYILVDGYNSNPGATLNDILLQVPLGVTYTPITDEVYPDDTCYLCDIAIQRLTTYSVTTPHHDTAIWFLEIYYVIACKENANDFTLYPNPVSGTHFTIRNDAKSPMDIEVYDMSGKRIQHNSSSDIYTIINVSNWKKGVYLVKIRDNKGITTRKVVVQ